MRSLSSAELKIECGTTESSFPNVHAWMVCWMQTITVIPAVNLRRLQTGTIALIAICRLSPKLASHSSLSVYQFTIRQSTVQVDSRRSQVRSDAAMLPRDIQHGSDMLTSSWLRVYLYILPTMSWHLHVIACHCMSLNVIVALFIQSIDSLLLVCWYVDVDMLICVTLLYLPV